MLKLAGFNSTIYSFNKKTGASFTPIPQGSRITKDWSDTLPLDPLLLDWDPSPLDQDPLLLDPLNESLYDNDNGISYYDGDENYQPCMIETKYTNFRDYYLVKKGKTPTP